MSNNGPLKSKMVSRVQASFTKSFTPQKYQGLANLLHYHAGVHLPDDLLDDPTYYGHAGWGAYWTHEIPDKFTAVNNEANIKSLVEWAQNQAMQRSLNRVIEKFKITDPALLQQLQANIHAIYNDYDDPNKLKAAVSSLKGMLITERIKSKVPNDYTNNKAKFDEIIQAFTQGNMDAQSAKQAIGALSPALASNDKKLNSILNSFAILRKIESPEQVAAKIEDEIYGEIHQKFAQEIEGMNNVERVKFDGTEVLYRGIPAKFITREEILAGFNNIHRAVTDMGDIGTHQIKTPWNKIAHPGGATIASNATATTLDPQIAISYSTSRAKTDEGWVFEVRPKKDQTAVALVNYEQRGDRYAELDMTQIDPKDIVAIHRIKTNPDGTTTVMESIQNPHYKKRASDSQTPSVFSEGATITPKSRDGTPYQEGVTREIQIKTKSGERSFDVTQSPAFQQHIQGKDRKSGNLPTSEEIRARRAAIAPMPKLQEHLPSQPAPVAAPARSRFGQLPPAPVAPPQPAPVAAPARSRFGQLPPAPTVPSKVQDIINQIQSIHSAQWAIGRNDKRSQWIDPLIESLAALDRSRKISPADKDRLMIKLLSNTYLSAKQGQGGFNAAEIAERMLKELNAPIPAISPIVQPQAAAPVTPPQPAPVAAPAVPSKVQDIINQIRIFHLTEAIKPEEDKRSKWLTPLINNLAALDRNPALSSEQKNEQMITLLSNTYLSAAKQPEQGGFNAARIAERMLQELNALIPAISPIVQPQAAAPVTPQQPAPVTPPQPAPVAPPQPQPAPVAAPAPPPFRVAIPQPIQASPQVQQPLIFHNPPPLLKVKQIQTPNFNYNAKEVNLNMLLELSTQKLSQDYQNFNDAKHANDKTIHSLFNLAKTAVKHINGTVSQREQQINDIHNTFSAIKKDNTIPNDLKAVLAYACLENVKGTLGKHSGMRDLCNDLQTKIDNAVPGTKNEFTSNNAQFNFTATAARISKEPPPKPGVTGNKLK